MRDIRSYANRLTKNARRLDPWARREAIHALRLYDCDVPEFPVVVERYHTDAGVRIHLQEVDTGWRQTAAEHEAWVAAVHAATAEVLAVAPEALIFKRRVRQRVAGERSDQYQPTGTPGHDLVVEEAGLRFWVNLEAHLDTGLFLDHRLTRAQIGKAAAGKRFLNLFAYTGSFTVHAAAGGARASVSVDLSRTYLEWTRRNLALNGLDRPAHETVRADVFAWLREARAAARQFDLAVLDPPTFSNSKRMVGTLDIQRDHAWLVRQTIALLAPDGALLFSTNQRTFAIDAALATEFHLEDISAATIPEDFRDRKIHQAWRIRHRQ